MTDQSTNEPPAQVKLTIIKQEQQPYINTRYVLEVRLRVVAGLIQKSILKEDDKKPIVDELTRMQGYIDGYNEIVTELEAEIKAQAQPIALVTAPPNGNEPASGEITASAENVKSTNKVKE